MTNEKAIERIKAFSIFLTGGNPIWDVDECKEAFDIALAAMSERNLDEWCYNCKEYDHNKHCCPRFNRVIRETVEEVKQNAEQKWISCKERLPEVGRNVLLSVGKGLYTAEGELKHDGTWVQYRWSANIENVDAWAEMPEPWKGEEDGRLNKKTVGNRFD